jgi:hypothetical protein
MDDSSEASMRPRTSNLGGLHVGPIAEPPCQFYCDRSGSLALLRSGVSYTRAAQVSPL